MKILSQRPIFPLSFLLTLFLLHVSNTLATNQTTNSNQTNLDYIKISCNVTLYQTLCYNSLYPFASLIDSNPKKLAIIALNLSLLEAKSTQKFIKSIFLDRQKTLNPKEVMAMKDCMEEMNDSIYELLDSIKEMNMMNYSSFEMVMSDVRTWVSAALTDEDTCMDGFEEEEERRRTNEVKVLVRKYIVRVGRMISNALALLNVYASTYQKY